MARFIATSGSYFEPFSYEQLVAPIQQATEAQNLAAETADTLDMQAGAIASMLDDSSPKFKALYDSYLKSSEEFANELWDKGYSANSARRLSALRRMYGNNITKINAAITKKTEAVKRYDDDLSKDKTLISSVDPRTLSLDEWYDNPYAGDYKAYSGALLTAKASALGENLKRDITENMDSWESILGGQYFERNSFTGFHAHEVNEAIRSIIDDTEPSSERVKLLKSAMQSVYDSSGIDAWASREKKAQALSYIGEGIYSSVGSNKSETLQDRSYASPLQWANALKGSGKSGSGGSGSQTNPVVTPKIASLRGNAMSGISDRKQAKEFREKADAYADIKTINDLMKAGALRNPNGTLSDTASEAAGRLYKNKYFRELSKGNESFLSTADLGEVLNTLGREIDQMETNDHMYTFNVTAPAAQNIARNVFKLNVGQLHGKDGDSVAGSVAKYSNGKDVSKGELLSILEDDNIVIGYDAKRGKITVQRNASSSSGEKGKYDDRVVYLDPNTALQDTSAYVNAAALLYALDSQLPDDLSVTDREKLRNRMSSMAMFGETMNLKDLSDLITSRYDMLARNGDPDDIIIFNSLVEAFAQGLFDSANAPWSPNTYKEGWAAKSGGAYMSDTAYDDYSDVYEDIE